MNRGSSLRLMEWPIPPTSAVVRGSIVPPSTQPCGGVLNRFHEVHVASAAAQIARDRMADLGLGRVRVATEQRDARHHHARRAVPALQSVLLPESFLNRVQLAALFEPFHGA